MGNLLLGRIARAPRGWSAAREWKFSRASWAGNYRKSIQIRHSFPLNWIHKFQEFGNLTLLATFPRSGLRVGGVEKGSWTNTSPLLSPTSALQFPTMLRAISKSFPASTCNGLNRSGMLYAKSFFSYASKWITLRFNSYLEQLRYIDVYPSTKIANRYQLYDKSNCYASSVPSPSPGGGHRHIV